MIAELLLHAQEFITAAMDRKRALTSDMLTRVFSELDDDDDGELGPRVFCSALQVRHGFTPACPTRYDGRCGGRETAWEYFVLRQARLDLDWGACRGVEVSHERVAKVSCACRAVTSRSRRRM